MRTYTITLRGNSWARDRWIEVCEPEAGPTQYWYHSTGPDGCFSYTTTPLTPAEALALVAQYGVPA